MIREIIKQIRYKKITITELTQDCFNKIDKLNPELNAFITLNKDASIHKAREYDSQITNSRDIDSIYEKHPLFGIPIAHKDIISTKGIETTAASNILREYFPPYNATIVNKLDEAGVIVLGKLNCDAFAHGASGENSDFGPSKNPYNPKLIPGGSSSGSAVSVASGMTIFATGTDTGGSLRTPASFTNTVGLKPTYGRVSRYGVIAMGSSLDSIGHITTTVEDSAYVLEITSGFDPNDATTAKSQNTDFTSNLKAGVKGLKFGLPKEYFGGGIDSEILESVMRTVNIIERNGGYIEEISLPNTEYAIAVYYIIMPSEVSSNLGRFDGIRFGNKRESFGQEAKRRIMIGTYVLSAGYYDAYYEKAQKARQLIRKDFEDAFKKVDVILSPVTAVNPLKLGENINDPLKMYLMDILTTPANLAGIPAISVPSGFTKNGLPIGIQLMGNYFNEEVLFRSGYVIEQENKLFNRKPLL